MFIFILLARPTGGTFLKAPQGFNTAILSYQGVGVNTKKIAVSQGLTAGRVPYFRFLAFEFEPVFLGTSGDFGSTNGIS